MISSRVFRKWLLTAVALLAGYWMITRVVVFSSVDRYRTPAWYEHRHDYAAPLVRMGENADVLLITQRQHSDSLEMDRATGEYKLPPKPPFAVYRYDSQTGNLSLVDDETWSLEGGPIADCRRDYIEGAQAVRFDSMSRRLTVNGSEVGAAGRLILKVNVAPSQSKVVIVSASGPKMFSLMPLTGDPGAFGQHYQQVLSLETLQFINGAVRLPFITAVEQELIRICWSPDERYIVYGNFLGDWISVVPVESR